MVVFLFSCFSQAKRQGYTADFPNPTKRRHRGYPPWSKRKRLNGFIHPCPGGDEQGTGREKIEQAAFDLLVSYVAFPWPSSKSVEVMLSFYCSPPCPFARDLPTLYPIPFMEIAGLWRKSPSPPTTPPLTSPSPSQPGLSSPSSPLPPHPFTPHASKTSTPPPPPPPAPHSRSPPPRPTAAPPSRAQTLPQPARWQRGYKHPPRRSSIRFFDRPRERGR